MPSVVATMSSDHFICAAIINSTMGKSYLKSDCLKSFYFRHDNFVKRIFFHERKGYGKGARNE